MAEKTIVLPMATESEPEFFGHRVDGYEVVINYRDLAKVKVEASDRTIRQLEEEASLFTSPLPGTDIQRRSPRFQRQQELRTEFEQAPVAPPKPGTPATRLDHGRAVLADGTPVPGMAADDPHGREQHRALVASERQARAAEEAAEGRGLGPKSAEPAPKAAEGKEDK